MKHTRKKSKGTWRHMLMLSFLLVAVVALVLGAPVPGVWAQDDDDDDDDEGPLFFEDATIIIEKNATDNDLGFQVFFDGEAWKKVKVKNPNGKKVFEVKGKGKLRKLGLTELFFETEEPEIDVDLTEEEILALFPPGEYEFKGKTAEGDKITGTATLTHDIPDGPVINLPVEASTIPFAGGVTIDWNLVADPAPPDSVITGYQVIVETGDDMDPFREFSIDLLDTTTSVTVPPELFIGARLYKFEVLAIETSGNQTIGESFFCTTGFPPPCELPPE